MKKILKNGKKRNILQFDFNLFVTRKFERKSETKTKRNELIFTIGPSFFTHNKKQ